MVINGELVKSDHLYPVVNPANEDILCSVPDAREPDLEAAVTAASDAFHDWAATPYEDRQKAVANIGSILLEHKSELSRLVTLEQGKALEASEHELEMAAQWCHGVSQLKLPVEILHDQDGRRIEMQHVPIGVVGAITPWNVPIIMAIWKIAPAVLAGNTVVLKPSPYTPLATLKLGALIKDLFPNGVVNVLSGGNDLGQWMTKHPEIGKISFTGSTETGRKVLASSSKFIKRVTLELGGNDAAIVMSDINVEEVAPALFWAGFMNSGQVCAATKRMYIHEAIYDELAEAIVNVSKSVVVGDGSEARTQLGPVQNHMQYNKVKSILEDSIKQGHQFLVGGNVPDRKGYYLPITIVDNPPEDSRVVVEEAFGPILPLLKFKDIDDVVKRANNTSSGLAASVWSNDIEQARAIASRLDSGTVWINEVFAFSPLTTFAGHKQSGLGCEHGVQGLLEYTNSKTITLRSSS